MPSHTEEEVRRRAAERQTAISNLTPDKPGLAARFGRFLGTGSRDARQRREADLAKSAETKRVKGLVLDEARATVQGDFRRIGEGFRAGSQDRPIDTSKFDVGGGTTDTTPRPPTSEPVSGEGPSGTPLSPDDPRFQAVPEDQIVVSGRQPASDPFNPDVQPDIPRPQLLSQTGANVIPRGGDKEQVQRPDFNRTGDLNDLPEGFIQTIRGAKVGFQDAAGNKFRSVPGLSPEDSRDVAARGNEDFRVATQESLDRDRNQSARITAEAQQLNAVANSSFDAINANDELEIFTRGVDGVAIGSGLTPDTIVNGEDEFTFETVEVSTGFAGQTENRTVMVARDGTRINVSEEFRQDSGRLEYIKLKKRNPDASPEELVQEAEDLVGGGALTDLRAELGL